MVQIVGERAKPGDAIVDYEEKVLPDYQAEEGQTAYIFFHTVPFEGSVGLVNLLTCTRFNRACASLQGSSACSARGEGSASSRAMCRSEMRVGMGRRKTRRA